RLEDDLVLSGRVHQQRRLQRRLAQAAERPAAGHRADEDAWIEEVLGQPDAVAQQRTLGEWRRWVDREHSNIALVLAGVRHEAPDQRRLADPGRPGEADDGRVPGPRVDLANKRPALGIVVLDKRDCTRERALIAV